MLYTITLNPAWDITYTSATVKLGLNRATTCVGKAGGKGINVSRAIAHAGGKSVAVAVLAGDTGDRIAREVTAEGIELAVLTVPGETRTNISLVGEDGNSLEINGAGTTLTEECRGMLLRWLGEHLAAGDVLCLCGSLPVGARVSLYGELCTAAGMAGASVVLDCSGGAMRAALDGAYPPTIIKPNGEELAQLCGVSLGKAELFDENGQLRLDLLRDMASRGVDLTKTAVLCTLGGDGAVWLSAKDTVYVPAVPVAVAKAEKGAGDTYLGTFLWKRYGCGGTVADAMGEAGIDAGKLVADAMGEAGTAAGKLVAGE